MQPLAQNEADFVRRIAGAENGHETEARCAAPYCRNGADLSIYTRDGQPICLECYDQQRQVNDWVRAHGLRRKRSLPYRIGFGLSVLFFLVDLSLFHYFTWPWVTNALVIYAELVFTGLFIDWTRPLWEETK